MEEKIEIFIVLFITALHDSKLQLGLSLLDLNFGFIMCAQMFYAAT
jgi:hypothetical protein